MVGSRDAFLLGYYPSVATARSQAHALIDAAVAAEPADAKLTREAGFAHKGVDRSSGTSSSAAHFLADRARDAGLTVPAFDASADWCARVARSIEPAIGEGSPRLAYHLGLASGALTTSLSVLATTLSLRALVPASAWLAKQLDTRLNELDEYVARLRGIDSPEATEALRILDARPDMRDTTHTRLGKRLDWIRNSIQQLGQVANRFVNEVPEISGPPEAEERQLLAEILRAPDADEPRERFAALAARRNDPRAKLIELQLTARDLRRSGLSPAYGEVVRKAASLITAHPEWSREIVTFGVTAVFHRGFVEEIECDLNTFLSRAPELYAVAPILHLRLHGAGGRVGELVASRHLARIRSLSLQEENVGDADIEALAASPHVAKLRWLELWHNRVTDAGVAALAASPHLESLAYVGVGNNPCIDPTDEKLWFNETQFGWEPTQRGRDLEARHGRLPWLHPRYDQWPPPIGVL